MVSPNLNQEPQIHIFKNQNNTFAFDPITVRLEKLDRDEAKFIEVARKVKNIHSVGSNLRWNPERLSKVQSSLSQKEMLPGQRRKIAKKNTPSDRIEIMVNATQECNLVCEYCFVDKGRFSYGETRSRNLSPEKTKKLVEILPKALPYAKEFCIHFYGGEPLLNLSAIRAAVDAVASTNDRRFSFAITTNGTICSEDAISILRKGHFNVILSIDGPAEVHDAVRLNASGGATHAKVLKFLQKIRQQPQLFVRGSSVIRRGWSLQEAINYLNTLPIDAVKAQAARLEKGHKLELSESDRIKYIEDLKAIANEVIDSVHLGKAPKDDRFNHRILQILSRTRRTAFCGAGGWVFGLAADGTVLPCVLLAGKEEMSLGNIKDPDAKWVTQGRSWIEKRKRQSSCQKCWALPLCGGGCPAMLSVCGEDECDLVRANCEMALAIYGEFLEHPADLLILAGY